MAASPSDGRPYLVMEYVDGVPITTYCDRHRLDIRARLRLFVDVCAAVQHAHQNLVIHRDLKPSNILVSADGRVHLLDFGIAKLIDPALAGARRRSRASNCAHDDAGVRQPGAGARRVAHDRQRHLFARRAAVRAAVRPAPVPASTTASPLKLATRSASRIRNRRRARARIAHTIDRLAQLLDGDLDSIVLMAMRKEPAAATRRPTCCGRTSSAISRGLPVLAHRGNAAIASQKFLRRHRVEAAAAAIVTGRAGRPD